MQIICRFSEYKVLSVKKDVYDPFYLDLVSVASLNFFSLWKHIIRLFGLSRSRTDSFAVHLVFYPLLSLYPLTFLVCFYKGNVGSFLQNLIFKQKAISFKIGTFPWKYKTSLTLFYNTIKIIIWNWRHVYWIRVATG